MHLVDAHGFGVLQHLLDGVPTGPRGGALRPAVLVVVPVVVLVAALAFPLRVAAARRRGGAWCRRRVLDNERRVAVIAQALVTAGEVVPRSPTVEPRGGNVERAGLSRRRRRGRR